MSLERRPPTPRGEGPKRKAWMPARTVPMPRGTGLARAYRKPSPRRDTGPSRKVRGVIWTREGGACAACGTSVTGRPFSLQHRNARGMGGTSDPEANAVFNLVLICGSATTPGSCHLACERRDPDMHARGFWLYSWEDPAEVPVHLACGAVVLLGATYVTVPPEEAAA